MSGSDGGPSCKRDLTGNQRTFGDGEDGGTLDASYWIGQMGLRGLEMAYDTHDCYAQLSSRLGMSCPPSQDRVVPIRWLDRWTSWYTREGKTWWECSLGI